MYTGSMIGRRSSGRVSRVVCFCSAPTSRQKSGGPSQLTDYLTRWLGTSRRDCRLLAGDGRELRASCRLEKPLLGRAPGQEEGAVSVPLYMAGARGDLISPGTVYINRDLFDEQNG